MWFYIDHAQQRQGPFEAAQMRDAYARGQLGANTPVWTKGMPQWQPLASVAAQLEIAVSVPIYSQNGPVIVRSSKGLSGCAITAIIAGALMFVVLPIIAAIALPAYQDYLTRSKVVQIVTQMRSMQIQAEEFYNNQGKCPEQNDVLKPIAPEIQSYEVGEDGNGRCIISVDVLFGSRSGRMSFVRNNGNWDFESNLPQKYLPAQLRQ